MIWLAWGAIGAVLIAGVVIALVRAGADDDDVTCGAEEGRWPD